MCRLLGWVSDEPRALADLLRPEELAEFTELSRLHADGWGIAWYDGDRRAADAAVRGRGLEQDARTPRQLPASPRPARCCTCAGLRRASPYSRATPTPSYGTSRVRAQRVDLAARRAARAARRGADPRGHHRQRALPAGPAPAGTGFGFDEGLRATIVDITAELTPSSLNAMLLGDGVLTAMCCNIGDAGCPGRDRSGHPARGAARLLRPALPPARGRDRGLLERLGRRREWHGWITAPRWCCRWAGARRGSYRSGAIPRRRPSGQQKRELPASCNSVATEPAEDDYMAGTLQLDVGCDFRFTAPASVAGVFQVEPTRDARHRLLSEILTTSPAAAAVVVPGHVRQHLLAAA